MKNRERETVEWKWLPNQEYIWILGKKKNSLYLRILDTDNTKQAEME